MDISFRLDPETIVGPDTVCRAGTICGRYSKRILVAAEQTLYDKQRIERLVGILGDSGIEAIVFDEISAQTTAEAVDSVVSLARGARCSAVIGFGGLKTQAIARMAAIITPERMPVFDLLDGHNAGDAFLPYIAIPTTGPDPFLFTDHFIAVDPRDRLIKQVKSPAKVCAAAIIDSNLLTPRSGSLAAIAALDGFCVAIEAYCSTRANFLSDALLEQAMGLYAKILDAEADGNTDFDLAGGFAGADFLAALGSASSPPGIGTALSYAINGRFPVDRSWSSSVLLPFIMERLTAARPEKMARAAAILDKSAEGLPASESAGMAADNIRRRMEAFKVPSRLKEFNLALDRLVTAAESARSMEFVAFTPWTVSAEDMFDILKQALGVAEVSEQAN